MAGTKRNLGFTFFIRTSSIGALYLGNLGRIVLWISLAIFILASNVWGGVGGSVSGTVTDATGAVVPDAAVSAINADSGVRTSLTTNGKGFYSFSNLPVGRYNVAIEKAGFKPYQRTDIGIDANSAVTVDAVLSVGQSSDVVSVVENQLQVETTSTQVGEVISSARMTEVPLNGRSFTDLLSLQPGVVPVTSITSDTVQDVGASAVSPSGDLNPGTVSINGQREFANSFIVNGSDVEEDVNMGAAVIPNLDSIDEFRIITNNFDAEYGEFSGGQINVITKSGSNSFHGNAFEFLRNTNLDARNYFSSERGVFRRNQFGGTFGGPIRKTKLFFFGDYQGTRSTQGIDTPRIAVPSAQDQTGNLADLAGSFTTTDANGNLIPTTCEWFRMGSFALTASGLCGLSERELLHSGLLEHGFESVCLPRSRCSENRVVRARQEPLAIYSEAE